MEWHRLYHNGTSKLNKNDPMDCLHAYVSGDYEIRILYHHYKVDSYVVYRKGTMLRGYQKLSLAKKFAESDYYERRIKDFVFPQGSYIVENCLSTEWQGKKILIDISDKQYNNGTYMFTVTSSKCTYFDVYQTNDGRFYARIHG